MSGQLVTSEAAVMQRAGNENTGGAAAGYGAQVTDVAHAAGGEHLSPRRTPDQFCQPGEVGAAARADPRQRHGDQPLRPAGGICEQLRRTGELLAAKVEREDERLVGAEARGEVALAQRLAADHRAAEVARLPGRQRGAFGDPGVDPQAQAGKSAADRLDAAQIVAAAQNRVEVGDIEIGERMKVEQRGDDIERRTAATQRRLERAVGGPLAPHGAHDQTAHQIDHRNQCERQDGTTLRILVYEHITGGGLADEPLPPSLAREGDLMLRALVDDLTALPGVTVVVTRDARLALLPAPAQTLVAHAGETLEGILQRGLAGADLAWPIAPESDRILERVCRFIEHANGCGTPLLGSSTAAVQIAASKFATAERLAAAGIGVVATTRDPALLAAEVDAIVIKPDDGAGCLDTRLHTRESALQWWATHVHGGHIAQPFVAGEALSLSLLCAGGEAQVLACNRQQVRAVDGALAFSGVCVNARPTGRSRYAALANGIAQALPGLWGYVGVDLIEAADGPLVVDVNPRLTTSYVALRRALGINPAALVLELLRRDAERPPGIRPDQQPGMQSAAMQAAAVWAELPAGVGVDIDIEANDGT